MDDARLPRSGAPSEGGHSPPDGASGSAANRLRQKGNIMAAKIVIVGSFNTDLTSYMERMPKPGETVHGRKFVTGPGGKGSNQAVAAARLGAEVTFVGRIGQDVFAPLALNLWKAEGIRTDYVVQ